MVPDESAYDLLVMTERVARYKSSTAESEIS